jgi:hypothetical protein
MAVVRIDDKMAVHFFVVVILSFFPIPNSTRRLIQLEIVSNERSRNENAEHFIVLACSLQGESFMPNEAVFQYETQGPVKPQLFGLFPSR